MLCKDDFLKRVNEIAECCPNGIILREKDMQENQYLFLAKKVMDICKNRNVTCILHSFVKTAIKLNCKAVHLSLSEFKRLTEKEKSFFEFVGVSCHSLEEAKQAEKLGCTYIVFGHVFESDCKKGIKPRGVDCLCNVCENTAVPVYAIGGIDEKNINEVKTSSAQGGCIMSAFMQCENVNDFMNDLRKATENEI